MPLVSVVIPLFNKGPHIARTINSVLSQTFQDFEVIVVDGGSTDNGVSVVKGFHDLRISLVMQDGKGVSQARNQGVQLAKTDLIAFLDADDEWMPRHLQCIIRLTAKYPNAGIFTTAYKIQEPDGKTRWANYKNIPEQPWEGLLPNYFESLARGEYPVTSSVVAIPKKIFIEAGGFPQGYWWGEDVDLFCKIALKYSVAFCREQGAIYHTEATNRTLHRKIQPDYEEPFIKTARSAITDGAVSPEFIEPLKECICQREIDRAMRLVMAGNGITARAILKKCQTRYHYASKVRCLMLSYVPYSFITFVKNGKGRLKIKNTV